MACEMEGLGSEAFRGPTAPLQPSSSQGRSPRPQPPAVAEYDKERRNTETHTHTLEAGPWQLNGATMGRKKLRALPFDET